MRVQKLCYTGSFEPRKMKLVEGVFVLVKMQFLKTVALTINLVVAINCQQKNLMISNKCIQVCSTRQVAGFSVISQN